jgi:hypothetical protein
MLAARAIGKGVPKSESGMTFYLRLRSSGDALSNVGRAGPGGPIPSVRTPGNPCHPSVWMLSPEPAPV